MYGLPLDKIRYVDTIRMCELERDLQILSAGDFTEIGEKGINLSGGQKARISLARAVYSNNDIFLMDDPISAVDANVKRKLIQNVILGHLASKTRVLVTHAIDFLHLADRVILMQQGRILAQGSYDDLKDNPQMQKLIKINKFNTDGEGAPTSVIKSDTDLIVSDSSQIEICALRDDSEILLNGPRASGTQAGFEGIQSISDLSSRFSSRLLGSNTQAESIRQTELTDEEKLGLFETLGRVSDEDDGKIIKDENEEIIKVVFGTYREVLKAGGGCGPLVALNVMLIGFAYCRI